MDKRSEFSAALKKSLLEKDQIASSTIRLILAALKDRDISVRNGGDTDGISDDEILLLLQSMVKQRQESSKTYSEAGRDDLAEREEAEIDVIRSFMPKQLNDQEMLDAISAIITEVSAESIRDMGKVMAIVKEKYAGQMDMGKAGGIAKQQLSA